MNKIDIVTVGSSAFDYVFRTGQAFTNQNGEIFGKLDCDDARRLAQLDEFKSNGFEPETYIGGAAANASVAASALLQAQGVPYQVAAITKIGSGEKAKKAKTLYGLSGVQVSDASGGQGEMSENLINIMADGSRQIWVQKAQFRELGLNDPYRKTMEDLLSRTRTLILHTRLPDLALMANDVLVQMGDEMPDVVIDASKHDETLDNLLHALPKTDRIYPVLPDELFDGVSHPKKVIEYLQGFGFPKAAVMCGRDPTLFWDSFDGNIKQIPVPNVKAEDTLGAGDTARAGFADALNKGLSFSEALSEANKIASGSCAFLGRGWINDHLKKTAEFELNPVL